MHPVCGADFEYAQEPEKPWFIANTNTSLSVMPLWVINLNNLVDAPGNCEQDYDVNLLVNGWFCYAPLVIRQFPGYAPVKFSSVTSLIGDIIIDYQESDREFVTYAFEDSSVNRIWLTKADVNNTITIDAQGQQNLLNFYIPENKIHKFYGISGNTTSKEVASEMYQMEYNLESKINDGTTIKVPTGCEASDTNLQRLSLSCR